MGSIISKTFKGKSDRRRQKMIWDALEAGLGTEFYRHVGTLLAYTPQEWNVELPAEVGYRRRGARVRITDGELRYVA